MSVTLEPVFAAHAEELRRAGFAVLPANGKRPLMRAFNKMRSPLGAAAVAKLANQHPHAAIAIIPGLSKPPRKSGSVVIVDADDDHANQRAEEIFGATPGQIRTRRGRHRLYRLHEGEAVGITSLRRWQLNIDLKHGHSIAIAPPSRHADDPTVRYSWIACDPTVIRDLPPFDMTALRRLMSQGSILHPNITNPPPPARPRCP